MTRHRRSLRLPDAACLVVMVYVPIMGLAYPEFGAIVLWAVLVASLLWMTVRRIRAARERTQGPSAPHALPTPRRGSGPGAEPMPEPVPRPVPRPPLTDAAAVRPKRKRSRRIDSTGVVLADDV